MKCGGLINLNLRPHSTLSQKLTSFVAHFTLQKISNLWLREMTYCVVFTLCINSRFNAKLIFWHHKF